MKIGKWKIEIKFLIPFGNTTVFYKFFKFTLFDIRISDLSGDVTICNIYIRWTKVLKAKDRQ